MKLSFLNLEQKSQEKNEKYNLKQNNFLFSIRTFIFYIILVLIFISISLKSKTQKIKLTNFSLEIKSKNLKENFRTLINEESPDEQQEKKESEDGQQEKKESEDGQQGKEEPSDEEKAKQESRKKIAENAGKMYMAYITFVVKTFYSILKLRAYEVNELENIERYKVWLYLYVTNNGYFIASLVLILIYSFTFEEYKEGYILFYISGGLFAIGTIAAVKIIITLFKGDPNFLKMFYSYDLVKPLYKMPFSNVKNFVFLKDKCCKCCEDQNQNPLEVKTGACSCCCCSCGGVTLVAKYFMLIATAIVYYGSLIFLTIILLIVISCFKICGKKQDTVNEVQSGNIESIEPKNDTNQNSNENESSTSLENNSNNGETNNNGSYSNIWV